MHPIAQIVLTLAVAAGTVAVYHVLADDGVPSAGEETALLADRDLADLEARVAALENRAPLLRGTTDGGERLLALESRVKSLETRGAPRAPSSAAEAEADVQDPNAPAADAPPTDETVEAALSEAQKQAVKRLVDGAVRERMQGRFAERTNRVLEQLGIELTTEQREKLDAAWAAHMESVRETFRAGREAGLEREEIGASLATLNQKLTQTVAAFLPAGDAESIVGALTTMPGPGSGRRPGGGPR